MVADMKATQTNRKESKHDRWVQPTKIVPLQGTNNIVIERSIEFYL